VYAHTCTHCLDWNAQARAKLNEAPAVPCLRACMFVRIRTNRRGWVRSHACVMGEAVGSGSTNFLLRCRHSPRRRDGHSFWAAAARLTYQL